MQIEYRYYQREAIAACAQYLYRTPAGSHPLIALPTGTGKSVVLSGFIYEFMRMYPQLRFSCITHVKELIAQNAAKMRSLWPNAPMGIHSAGLNRRDTAMPIIFGGIKSMLPNLHAFGWRDFILVDEAHLVSPEKSTQYAQFINESLKINPNLRVIGLTATAWRTKQGELAGNGNIFTDICYDLCSLENFNRMIAEGWLCPIVPRPTRTEFDVSKLRTSGDDYNLAQMEAEFDREELTRAVLAELCEYGANRRSWLIFASGVNHAEHVADMLNSWGIPTACVHSKMPAKKADKAIEDYQNERVRCIVNFGKLTTGFDDPKTDLIGMLRATKSSGLWVQMLGRGTRPSPFTGKNNCLCLDFAGNARRLGPINDPVIPGNKKKGGGGGAAPIKICSNCGNWCHASVRFCEWCGTEFVQNVKLQPTAGTDALIASDLPVVEPFDVARVWVSKYVSNDPTKPPMLKCTYYVHGDLRPFNEYVLLEHDGFPKHRAHDWWRARHSTTPPETVDEALKYIEQLRPPRQIKVWLNNKPHPQVVGYVF